MNILWITLGVLGLVILYIAYDRICWYLAKLEESRRGVQIIAEHIADLRDSLASSNSSTKKELDDIFKSIQLENARIAYTIGGVKLLDKVANATATYTRPTVVKTEATDSRKIQVV